MKIIKKRALALACAVIFGITMSACSTDNAADSISSASSPAASVAPEAKSTSTVSAAETTKSAEKIEVAYNEEDLDSTWQDGSYTKIEAAAESIQIDGNGAKESEGIITITAAGTYVFSGTFLNSQIVVDAGKNDVVQIVLNNAAVTCEDSAAINGVQSEKIILTLAEGSENQLEDGSTYTNLDSSEEPNAALFSKDDIVINGTGTLSVTGNYNHGIVSKDDLTIISGNLKVHSVNDGIKGKDSIVVRDGTFSIISGGDGMQSNNDTDAAKGYIVLEGGTYTIDASMDGIQAESVLQISGGQFEIYAGEESTSADAKANSTQAGDKWERGNTATTETETGDSKKALKGGSAVYILEGTIRADSFEDSIHSNGTVTISGGTMTLSAGDDAVHADSDLLIEGGTIDITGSYEGLEGNTITIADGSIHVKATDDGINANGGSGSFGGAPQGTGSTDTSTYVRITGGYLYVDAGGDGLDSNGMLYIDGGTTIVCGPTNGGNGALDYDGTAEITGGVLIAAGSSQMAQAMSDSSTQASLFISYTSAQAAGTLVNLLDENGNTVFRFAPSKEYSSIVISTPSLASGRTYTLTSGGSVTGQSAAAADGYYPDGSNTTGTKLTDVTLTDMVTKISDDGTAVTTNGMGGGMGRGGMGRKGEGGMEKPSGTMPPANE